MKGKEQRNKMTTMYKQRIDRVILNRRVIGFREEPIGKYFKGPLSHLWLLMAPLKVRTHRERVWGSGGRNALYYYLLLLHYFVIYDNIIT